MTLGIETDNRFSSHCGVRVYLTRLLTVTAEAAVIIDNSKVSALN